MKEFRIPVYDVETTDILTNMRRSNRGRFIELAIQTFLETEEGKRALYLVAPQYTSNVPAVACRNAGANKKEPSEGRNNDFIGGFAG
jgi:hypothetical protein